MPNEPQVLDAPSAPKYQYDATLGKTEILRKCLRCGELMPRSEKILEFCPSCHAPKTEFVLVDED